jgi:hypothetical protein
MKPFAPLLLACVVVGALAFQTSAARSASASAATKGVTSVRVSSSRDPLPADSGSDSRQNGSSRNRHRDPSPAAPQRPRATSVASLRRELVEQRKEAALQKAEVDARAKRIYDASQTSAPIIIDAKACKHVGANGESIYENC